jgi:hypothetical protein
MAALRSVDEVACARRLASVMRRIFGSLKGRSRRPTGIQQTRRIGGFVNLMLQTALVWGLVPPIRPRRDPVAPHQLEAR